MVVLGCLDLNSSRKINIAGSVEVQSVVTAFGHFDRETTVLIHFPAVFVVLAVKSAFFDHNDSGKRTIICCLHLPAYPRYPCFLGCEFRKTEHEEDNKDDLKNSFIDPHDVNLSILF